MILSIIFPLIFTLSIIFTTFIFLLDQLLPTLFYKTSYLYEEVNRTKPPPVSIPCCKQKTNLTN